MSQTIYIGPMVTFTIEAAIYKTIEFFGCGNRGCSKYFQKIETPFCGWCGHDIKPLTTSVKTMTPPDDPRFLYQELSKFICVFDCKKTTITYCWMALDLIDSSFNSKHDFGLVKVLGSTNLDLEEFQSRYCSQIKRLSEHYQKEPFVCYGIYNHVK